MSRSLSDLRYELKTNGRVSIPHKTVRSLASSLSVAIGPAAFAGVIWWRAEATAGPLIAIGMLIAASLLIVLWSIRDWRKRVIATPTHLHLPGEPTLSWAEIEKIGVPAARSILSIQLSRDGFLGYAGQSPSESEGAEFLASAGDRVVVWSLSGSVTENELLFLREQIKRS